MGEDVQAFVIGQPIAHSRSPLIHRHWLKLAGVQGDYTAIDVASEGLGSFLTRVRGGEFVGGNVTIPHKEEVFKRVAAADTAATAIGAVNTLWTEAGKLIGGNTDAYGFAANLDARASEWRDATTALIIGAGGASRAVVKALRDAKIGKIMVANRTAERAGELALAFPGVKPVAFDQIEAVLGHADLLINTTSLGMGGYPRFELGLDALSDQTIVADIVYTPLVTPLLAKAGARGLKTVDGLGMLLHQAVPGFERWFGIRPKVTPELRQLIEADLGKKR